MSETDSPQFTAAELERYSHQLATAEWGPEAQTALREATVFVVGAGSLGSAVAAYLAGAGVGRLAIVDGGTITLDGLHRQFLAYTPEVGMGKADSAAAKLSLLNPLVHVDAFPAFVEESNAALILDGADLVIDCTDDAKARYLINDTCVATATKFVIGSAAGFDGFLMSVAPGETACFRCAFPNPAIGPGGSGGDFGPIAGAIGSLQALEALKLLTGIGEPITDAFQTFDGRSSTWAKTLVQRSADCSCATAVSSDTL